MVKCSLEDIAFGARYLLQETRYIKIIFRYCNLYTRANAWLRPGFPLIKLWSLELFLLCFWLAQLRRHVNFALKQIFCSSRFFELESHKSYCPLHSLLHFGATSFLIPNRLLGCVFNEVVRRKSTASK